MSFLSKRGCFLLLIIVFCFSILHAQEQKRVLSWKSYVNVNNESIPFCEQCDLSFDGQDRYISYYGERFKGYSHENFEAIISDKIYTAVNLNGGIYNEMSKNVVDEADTIQAVTQYESGNPYLFIRFRTLRKTGSTIEKLESFTINITLRKVSLPTTPIVRPGRRSGWTNTSVLATGTWFRVTVAQEGIYKMDVDFLKGLGVELSGLDPRTIKIYSGHGNILPEKNSVDRPKDLVENAIYVKGEQDGKFDADDYVLFYGNAPSKFVFDSVANDYKYSKNFYAKETVYFITYGGVAGKRVASKLSNNADNSDLDVSEFDDVFRSETDQTNLIKSGKIWYGEHFDRVLSYTFSHDFPNRVAGSAVKIKTIMVARSLTPSLFKLNLNGVNEQISIGALGTLDYESPVIVTPTQSVLNFASVSGNTLNLTVTYNKPLSSSEGWCDYVEFHVKRKLVQSGGQTVFANLASTQVNKTRFELQGTENIVIWDVSDPFDMQIQQTDFSNNKHQFVANTKTNLRKYISTTSYLIPKGSSKVFNQNIHGVRDVDYIIVTHPDFKSAAERLAQFHRDNTSLNVQVVTTREVYNEFSHGIQDVTAIRDFMKMLWDEASTPAKRPKYLLLFGDASYDFLDITENNTNRVPTFESVDSHNPGVSFCSDDYFALMDDSEGNMDGISNIGMLDLAVGRLVVNSISEADAVVNKLVNYNNKTSFGNWRTSFTFLADDMDSDWEKGFVLDNERYTEVVEEKFPFGLFNKIYLDAYPQKSMGGGERYPDAVESINNNIEKGTLLWSYNGHGGTFGLASERVLVIPQINAWRNINKLPLFVTATCEFSRYDDPAMVSGGENTLLNPYGGAIGLLTTTRLVLVSTNIAIQNYLYDNSFYAVDDQGFTPMGFIYKATKNRPSPGSGDRFFTFLGDPALRLAIPRYRIMLDSLNGVSLTNGNVDTLKALSKITLKGRVINDDSTTKTDFNGIVYPTVLDKPATAQTRANDANAKQLDYQIQNNIIYRGRVQATNGEFTFSFIVPKDINYRFDSSRISIYAENQQIDAAGYENRIIVGGSADSAGTDNKGPSISLFMNDFSFVNGGMTTANPVFLATLYDENGINTAGSGIGREIIATLDKGTQQERSIVLNEFFQTKVDSYQEGELKYHLANLPTGKHTITLKAWDVYNNSAEATLEFIVDKDEDIVLSNILNYPNPFSTHTNFHFDHNKPGQDLTVQIQIMTISGRVVKNFYSEIIGAESHIQIFDWDARDEYGDKLAKGVYIYRLRVKSGDGKWVEKFEKLMLLN